MLWLAGTMPDNAPNAHRLPPCDEHPASDDKFAGVGGIKAEMTSIRLRLLELKAEQASLETTLANLQCQLSALETIRSKPVEKRSLDQLVGGG